HRTDRARCLGWNKLAPSQLTRVAENGAMPRYETKVAQMPSSRLDTEIEHLAEARQRIAAGEERIAKQKELIENLRSRGIPTDDCEAQLTLLKSTMAGWLFHRTLIELTIVRLRTASIGSILSKSFNRR
ncbi:hypothetical protein AB4144_42825, partial [Rhizobiaceae sp. 2RAB30]